jgi:AcrR family transcriptional regulator
MAPRPNASADEILDITFDLIAEHDVAGVTVDMVAAKAGVSKATIYRRWESRQALLVEAMTRLRRPGISPDTGSLREDLTALLKVLVGYLSRPKTARVFASFLNAAARDPELAALQREISQEARSDYERVLRRAIERGLLPADVDVQFLIDLLISPFLYRGVVEHAPAPESDIDRVIDAVLGRFGPMPTQARPKKARAAHT